MNKLQILKQYFGYATFRPLQEEVIDAILNHQDVLMVLPTGGGKSLCYQLPTLLMEGVTVVISPLLALMHDQVTALQANGISAAMLSSMQTHEEAEATETALLRGDIRLLYVAPERLNNRYFVRLLQRLRLNFFVVDEAHCVSEWGHEFREDYRRLSLLKEQFSNIPVAAFTATATEAVEQDIGEQLLLASPKRVRGALFRDNLMIHTEHRMGDGRTQLIRFLEGHTGEAGIVYTLSRRSTETLARFLQDKGIVARAYHAALPTEEKHSTYTDFVADRVQVVVATIAFGMGIDKSNIRFVVHMSLPKTIENYYQEIGRAGRDGLASETLLLFGAQDVVQQRSFVEDLPPSPYREHALAKLEAMVRFAGSDVCRHQAIAAYFNDHMEACAVACDNCTLPPSEKVDITDAAQKLLSAIWRTGQAFGLKYVVDVLRGSQEQRLLSNHHDALSVYGIGKEYSTVQWRVIGDRLLELGAIAIGEYSVYTLTTHGGAILKGDQSVEIKATRLSVEPKPKKLKNKIDLNGDDAEVFEALRLLRMEIAQANHIPPYVIFSDKTLKEMCIARPSDREEMLEISGVGEVKFERYGEEFLARLALSAAGGGVD